MTQEERKDLYSIREKYFNHLKISANNNKILDDLKKLYPPVNSQAELLEQVNDLKKCLDSFRPFDKFQVKSLEEYYETLYTYDSNRIEGNRLTLDETNLVINKGLTIGGKPLKDHLEAINHKEAYQYIRELAQNQIEINKQEVLNIHALILRSISKEYAGQYRTIPVEILGSNYIFAQPFLVPKLMEDFFIGYEDNKAMLHPVLLAGEIHERLVTIHPFVDGNGRTSRLLMNFILLKNGFPIVNISGDENERQEYYRVLEYSHMKSDKKPWFSDKSCGF